ncbi:hypothetical protein IF2G_01175 [Cordyceps javanica]|nr:hypothetical protein IF2G_01175 [Cordyceps javanica]
MSCLQGLDLSPCRLPVVSSVYRNEEAEELGRNWTDGASVALPGLFLDWSGRDLLRPSTISHWTYLLADTLLCHSFLLVKDTFGLLQGTSQPCPPSPPGWVGTVPLFRKVPVFVRNMRAGTWPGSSYLGPTKYLQTPFIHIHVRSTGTE